MAIPKKWLNVLGDIIERLQHVEELLDIRRDVSVCPCPTTKDLPIASGTIREPRPLLADAKPGRDKTVNLVPKACKACNGTGIGYAHNLRGVHNGKTRPRCTVCGGLGVEPAKKQHPIITGYNRLDYIPVDGIRMPDKPAETHTEPRPLLADAKEGWICKHIDQSYSQINYVRRNVFGVSGKHSGRWFFENGRTADGQEGMETIIHTEPLAGVGTKKWAWQRMLLGEKVFLHNAEMPRGYWELVAEDNKLYAKNSAMGWMFEKDEFLIPFSYNGTGWKIYEPEPALQANGLGDCEPEPQPKVNIGDCKIEFVKQELKNLLDKI